MSKKLIAPALLAAVLMTGCLPTANPAATNANPSAAPSTAPSAGTNTGANTGAAAAFFANGRSWDYTMNTTAAGQAFNGTFKIEVSEVKDGKATLKVTTNMPPAAPTTNVSTVDVNDSNGFNSQSKIGTSTPKSTSTESVTVPAGTFTATKNVYEQTDANAMTTIESWIVDGVGMVKQTQTTKPTGAAPNIPNIPGMPAGGGFDLTATTKIELTKFTK